MKLFMIIKFTKVFFKFKKCVLKFLLNMINIYKNQVYTIFYVKNAIWIKKKDMVQIITKFFIKLFLKELFQS